MASCSNFRETGDVISKVAFKMFFGVVFETTNWNNEGTAFSLVFTENPLTDFVELPPQYKDLTYCNILVGNFIIIIISLSFFLSSSSLLLLLLLLLLLPLLLFCSLYIILQIILYLHYYNYYYVFKV